MKIATWNVNSIAIRLEQVLQWLADTGTDVLCLQETKCVDERFPLETINDAGYNAAFFGQKSYNGVAIISKHEIADVQKNMPGSEDDDEPKRLIA
ncbi:endonuclease/exonuclease/phosphatase family protein, partial [Escherichia coli]|uniref:endonuclease/exonuclease/phosphatase family protein n=1 Tax=Escherichia coli TaxID=562 RepID=UPI001601BD10